MHDTLTLWSCVLNMTIASYLHRASMADAQIRRMAKRYLKEFPRQNTPARKTLRAVIKSDSPRLLVQLSYEQLSQT